MKLRILKLHPNAQVPTYATDGSACFDLYAAEVNGQDSRGDVCSKGYPLIADTGLAFEVPDGYMLRIASRSGLAFNKGITAFPGVIDSDFRAAVKVLLISDSGSVHIKPGDRIAQAFLCPSPKVTFEVAEQLSITERGEGGFGSTGQ